MQDDHADEQFRRRQAPVTRIMRLDTREAKRLIKRAIEQPANLFGRIEGLVDWLYTNLVDHQIDEFTDLWAAKTGKNIISGEKDAVDLANELPNAQKIELAMDWLSDTDFKAMAADWLSDDDVASFAEVLPKFIKLQLMRKWLDELAD